MDDTLQWFLDRLPEDELRKRLQQVEYQLSELERVREVLTMALRAREVASGPGAEPSPINPWLRRGSAPGTTEAVRMVLRRAGRAMTTTEIMAALKNEDWLPESKDPRKAVGATLSRMAKRTGELEYLGRATYQLSNTSYEPLALNPGGSTGSDRNRPFTGSAIREAES